MTQPKDDSTSDAVPRRRVIGTGLAAAAATLAVGTPSTHAATPEDDMIERMLIEHDCAKLVNRFHHLFNRDFALVASPDLFTEDAVLDLGVFSAGPGLDAMRSTLQSRPENPASGERVVLNTASNVVIDVVDEHHATGISHDTQWRHVFESEGGKRPAPVPLPTYLGFWSDEFRREGDVWKFAGRKLRFTFDQRRWSESEEYPAELVMSHEQWRKSIRDVVK